LAAAGVLSKVGAGRAGFDYTKLDAGGAELPADAEQWPCVRDNVTGLTWEIKAVDGGLHDKNWTYTWYETDAAKNGGKPGKKNGGRCGKASRCDTQGFVQAVNAAGWCGHNDWRLPTRFELSSLLDHSKTDVDIDIDHFPETESDFYWTASPFADNPKYAWFICFCNGAEGGGSKTHLKRVRLVRGGR
jgi:hypothetical protein